MQVTLRDAGDFIAKLLKREHDKPDWQLAAKDLMRAAAGHGPWRFIARIAMMHALYGRPEPPIGTERRTAGDEVARPREARSLAGTQNYTGHRRRKGANPLRHPLL